MRIRRFSSFDELAPYAGDWDRLSGGVPFRSWAWISCWWRHYGPAAGRFPQLLVLGVFDCEDRLVGLAPWCLDRSRTRGRVIRWLGSGEVCSDYLSLLAEPGAEDRVADALAEYLMDPAGTLRTCESMETGPEPDWDLLELGGIDAEDRAVERLADALELGGLTVDRRPGPNCWRVGLPASWDEYLATLSKGHRKQLRRLERDVLDSPRAVLHTVQRADELPRAWDILVDLHQRRHQDLGQPGCFASPRFSGFHREVMPLLLGSGRLQLHWLELDGRPIAAEYQIMGDGILYAYQAGIDPERLREEPGRLITLATLRRAIAEGHRAMDFLRGDEPYKAHFRAERRPTVEIRIVPDHVAARLRHGLWSAGRRIKRWMNRNPARERMLGGENRMTNTKQQMTKE